MAGINSRILINGLPQVAAALNADVEQAIWFTQSYMFAATVVLFLIGRAADIFGRVKIYLVGFVVFTVGAALTSLSQLPVQVILFRGVQGFGAGILSTNSVAMIVDATPPKEIGFSLGLNQSIYRFGGILGLSLSGLILSVLDWRALFYINVPMGIFGTLWARRRLKEIVRVKKNDPIDWGGFITITISIASFLFALTFAGYGIGEQTAVLFFLAVSGASLLAFVAHERKTEHPLLDLRLLRIREFTGGIFAQLLNTAAFGAVLLLISLYLQLVIGLSALEAGLRMVPFEAMYLAFGIISGRLSDRYGCRPFTTLGLALSSASLFLFSTVDVFTPYSMVLIYMLVYGAGIGLFTAPNISSIMGCVPADRRGVASAFRSTAFEIGFTISLNLAIFLMTLTVPYAQLTHTITSLDPVSIAGPDRLLFVEAMQKTYIWLGVLNLVAIVPSVLRGKRSSDENIARAYKGMS